MLGRPFNDWRQGKFEARLGGLSGGEDGLAVSTK